jgi:hypothetical protein
VPRRRRRPSRPGRPPRRRAPAPQSPPLPRRARDRSPRVLTGPLARACPRAAHARHALVLPPGRHALGDAARFFAAVAQLLPLTPIDRGPFPKRIAGKTAPRALLRPLWGVLFDATPGPGLLPREDADREALVGVGRWLAWIWRAGKPLPLSRVAIRIAFGGRLRRDYFADTDPEFAARKRSKEEVAEWLRTRAGALKALRLGVLAAEVVVDDDPLLPRAFQLRPFTRARGAKRLAGVFETPLVRLALWEEQVRAKNSEAAQPAIVDQVIARFE